MGNYNLIKTIDLKLKGIPHIIRKIMDFTVIIEACGLMDIRFGGKKFTWSNKVGVNHIIWRRLDRSLINDTWLDLMPQTTLTH